MDSEYKEGREYILSEFIKDGSYGEVHSAQDVNTGFQFAVKKVAQNLTSWSHFPAVALFCSSCVAFLQIAMKRFNSEEVGAWSTLRSPRVAELFGVVREGPYVLLLMDLKAGKTPWSPPPLSHTSFDADITNDTYNARAAEKDGDEEGTIKKKTVLWFRDDISECAVSLWFV